MAPNKQLKAWLKANKLRPAEFARRIEYDRSNFHNLLEGNFFPSLELALKIEKGTEGDIPMSAWAEAKAKAA